MDALFAQLDKIVPLSDACKNYLRQHLSCKKYQKDELLLSPGMICTDMAFIHSGFLEVYAPSMKGMITTRFLVTGDLYLSVISFYQQTPAVEYTKALDDTILCLLTYDQMKQAFELHPDFYRLVIALSLKAISSQLSCIYMMRMRERYTWLRRTYRNALPSYRQHIAICVGLTPEIIKKLRKRNPKLKK